MTEHPILFSDSMVSAILDGRKTQTRRVMKPQPLESEYEPGLFFMTERKGREIITSSGGLGMFLPYCPYGQPGDRLWVREAWLEFGSRPLPGQGMPDNACIDYRADYKPENLKAGIDADGDPYPAPKWRPSIHMPRWASRILLKVTAIRVERLQEISSSDAWAEGTRCSCLSPVRDCGGNIIAFRELWDSIYSKRGNGWDANPWVWGVDFKKEP